MGAGNAASLACVAILLVGAGVSPSQSLTPPAGTAYVVRPESVRAHEEFLASDVLAGRESATRDEEIAATYVASQFLGYGLKTAPAMTGYLQNAGVFSPVLDGHAGLTAGAVELHEGADFELLVSNGRTVRGPLIRVPYSEVNKTKTERGAAIVVTGAMVDGHETQKLNTLRGSAPSLIIMQGGSWSDGLLTRYGGKTRVPVRLKDSPASTGGTTVVALSKDALARLERASGTVSLSVHEIVQAKPRQTFNAVGYLPGSDAAAGTILLTAHLDHLGTGAPVNGDGIYNGANDDAAGTTAVLELAHALASGPQLRRSVLFVCYGSEEVGELGSDYFGRHTPVPLNQLVANLEFEMIGTQDPKMPKGVLLLTGWERSNLGPVLKQHGALLGPDPYPEQHFFERSDNYQLALQGVVAHTAAGWGTPPTYHQPSDDVAHLDIGFMTAAIQSLIEPIRWLATSDFRPAWNPGGQPKGRNQ